MWPGMPVGSIVARKGGRRVLLMGFTSMSPYLYLVPAALLLLAPLWALRAATGRLGGFDQRAWPRGRNLVLSFADFVRGVAGAWFLNAGVPLLPTIAGAPEWMSMVWLGAGIGLALAVEALTWRDEDYLQAPLLLLLGICAVLVHPLVMGLVLPLSIGAALALRAWSPGFIAAGVGLAGVGMVVKQQDWALALVLGVVVNVPVVLTVLVGRHLGAPRK